MRAKGRTVRNFRPIRAHLWRESLTCAQMARNLPLTGAASPPTLGAPVRSHIYRCAAVPAAFALSVALGGCSASSDEDTSSSTTDTSSPAQQESSDEGPSQESEPAASEKAAEPVTITITDFEYEGPATVAPGAEIEVVNEDRSVHSVTSEDDAFTEVIVDGGGSTGTFTAPSEPGKYPYICKFHPEMTGTLVVK